MAIDIESIKLAIVTIGSAIQTLKQAKDLLPDSSEKEEVDEALKSANRQLSIAESQIAQGLEYELCRNHFPPGIMVSEDDRLWTCPECGNQKNTGLAQARFNSINI